MRCRWLGAAAAGDNLVRVAFRETDALFAVRNRVDRQQRSRKANRASVLRGLYPLRLVRSLRDPSEGQYNWKLIDDDVIAAWKPRGAAVSMRVMTCNAPGAGCTSPK